MCKVLMGVIVLLVIVVTVNMVHFSDNTLSGVWTGDPTFLKNSQLSDMQLFISPKINSTRQGYLIMTDADGGIITNDVVDIDIRSPLQRWWCGLKMGIIRKKYYRANNVVITSDNSTTDSVLPFPEKLKLVLSPSTGGLTLFDDDKVYAYLIRDNLASSVAISVY